MRGRRAAAPATFTRSSRALGDIEKHVLQHESHETRAPDEREPAAPAAAASLRTHKLHPPRIDARGGIDGALDPKDLQKTQADEDRRSI